MESTNNANSFNKVFATNIRFNEATSEAEGAAISSAGMVVDQAEGLLQGDQAEDVGTNQIEVNLAGPNGDVLRVLMEIIYKMDQIEQNQRTLSYNQSVLMKMVEEIKQDAVPKSEVLAQQHLMRECKLTLKKVESSVCKITGEVRDKYMDEVASALPLQNVLEVLRVEERLKVEEYAVAMAHMFKIKGISEDIPRVVKEIFSDTLMEEYNWAGAAGKKSLQKLSLFETFLRDVFIHQGHALYKKGMRKAVELSHHRMAQRKFGKKQKLVTAQTSPPAQ
ncbi:uncharacterized protein [Eurosta solidaginis]|uniref:uncharacterized protein isoform X2 n=1 Tax=Eurosta solidaginis TaxID=178769 RepID=UPI0035316012